MFPERIHSLGKNKEGSQSFLSMLLGYCCCYWWQQTAERLNRCLSIPVQCGLHMNTFPSQHSVSLSLAFHACFSPPAKIHHLFKTFHKILLFAVKFSLSGTLVLLELQRQNSVTYWGFGSSYFFTKIVSKYLNSTFIVKFFLKFQLNFYSFWKTSLICSLFKYQNFHEITVL